VEKTKALSILNREKNYEDSLVDRISIYFISRLDTLQDLSKEERDKVEHHLMIILSDSRRHSDLFNGLVEMVYERKGGVLNGQCK
jgi:hypothetical protein